MLNSYLEIKNFLENHTSYETPLNIFNNKTRDVLKKIEAEETLNKSENEILIPWIEFLEENNDFFQLSSEIDELKKIKNGV